MYLDYSSTTPVDSHVIDAMTPYMRREFGNAAAAHSFGQRVTDPIETARRNLMELVGAKHPDEIVFTSGGTESNNLAIKGVAYANEHRGRRVLVSKIEHPSVLRSAEWLATRGFAVQFIDVDRYGTIDLDQMADAITADTVLVSVMHSNNELGTIQPIESISELCKSRGVCFHTDAVQSAGKVALNVESLNVDLMSVSAHKFYGPKGVGALYVRRGTTIESIHHGGYHEKGRRAGTLNVPGIVGLGAAAELAGRRLVADADRMARLRDMLEVGLRERINDMSVNGNPHSRLPNLLNVSFRGVESEALILGLDMRGIAVLGGSACSSQAQGISHVLDAVGMDPELARGSLRFSLGRYTTSRQILRVLEIVPDVVKRLRRTGPMVHTKKNDRTDHILPD
ncbi:MAG: cysteine desulfurase [Candidatus Hydrogenedentes bacterium]|nr:cysteine desulfurase [Candidatus Hydrogenedentota bacterium]